MLFYFGVNDGYLGAFLTWLTALEWHFGAFHQMFLVSDAKYCSECPQELGFDYLRDNLAANSEQLVMRWYVLGLFQISSYLLYWTNIEELKKQAEAI